MQRASLFAFLVTYGLMVYAAGQEPTPIPPYSEIKDQVEETFPFYYRHAQVKNWVTFDIKPITNEWDTRMDGQRKAIWSVHGTVVTTNDRTAFFTGTVAYRPDEAQGQEWHCKLSDSLPPLSDEMTR